MAEKNPAYVIAARTDHKADVFRQVIAGLAGRSEGVFGPNDLAVTQDTGSNMNSSTSAGGAFMYGDESVTQGAYVGYNDAAVTLTHGAAPGTPGQTRYDLVVAKVQDAAYSGVTNAWSLAIVAGTASASPADPSVPNNAIVLARVSVAFGQTTVTNANITDLRPRMAANGGISVVNSARRPGATYGNRSSNGLASPANPATLQEGMTIYETDTDKIQVYDGSSWVPRGNIAICTAATRPTAFEGNAIYETDTDKIQVYDGAGWVPRGNIAICTSSTRPTAFEGMAIYETDTDRILFYDGSAWQRISNVATGGRTGGTWRRNAVQSIASSVTPTAISWDAEDADTDGFCTPTSATITIPAGLGGIYAVKARSNHAANNGSFWLCRLVFSSAGTYMGASNGFNASSATDDSATYVGPLAASETIQYQVAQSTGGAVDHTARITVYRIGI